MASQEAVQCLKLADSYIDEVVEVIEHVAGDENRSYQLLKTLDLAMKQVDKAEQIDSSAIFEGLDIPHARAWALAMRGVVENTGLGKRSKAISTFQQAIEVCEDMAWAHYGLGTSYAETGNKEEGLKHLKRAVELKPENIEFRKVLDRLENVSGAALKLGAFHGSWKTLLILVGISVLGGLVILSGGSAQGAIVVFLFFGVIAFLYWKIKSR